MGIEKINIEKDKFDINLKFYFILKYLTKANLNSNDINKILELYSLSKNFFKDDFICKIDEIFNINTKSGIKKSEYLKNIFELLDNDLDIILFIFSIKLIAIKPLLLEEAKTRDLLDKTKLTNLNPLSLEYDKITVFTPYSTRVSGALLSLIFFDKLENNDTSFLSSGSTNFLKQLSKDAIFLKNNKIEANQIFMLMFSESINQSILSDSGSNYEDRIFYTLRDIGIDEKNITKTHDKNDSSTEFDFFFELNNKTYGIGAKRTLRERYKQFIKTAQMSKIDVMIEITLGIDLTKDKVEAIRNHNIYLFVADEVYTQNKYLQSIEGIFSVTDLTMNTLKKLK